MVPSGETKCLYLSCCFLDHARKEVVLEFPKGTKQKKSLQDRVVTHLLQLQQLQTLQFQMLQLQQLQTQLLHQLQTLQLQQLQRSQPGNFKT